MNSFARVRFFSELAKLQRVFCIIKAIFITNAYENGFYVAMRPQSIDINFEDNGEPDQIFQLTFDFNNETKEEEGTTVTPIGGVVSPINFNP